MRTAYAMLGLLFLLVFGGAFFFLGTDREPEYAGGPVVHTKKNVPIISDVPRDAIPPLDNARYESVAAADEWIDDDAIVLGVEIGDDIRAYPILIMNWHEIVNERIGGQEVAVTYCPLCDSGIVFDRNVNGQLLSFGNTGSLYESAMVMYDRETESYWWQAGAQAIKGELEGTQLTILPSFMSRWRDWKQNHPNSRVLSRDTGYTRPYTTDSFIGYDELSSQPGFPISDEDDRLFPKERIIGIVVNGKAKAYPVQLAQAGRITDTFNGETIEIFGDNAGRTAQAFFLQDGELERAPVVSEFWFSWVLSHPDTEIYTPTSGS